MGGAEKGAEPGGPILLPGRCPSPVGLQAGRVGLGSDTDRIGWDLHHRCQDCRQRANDRDL